MNSHYWNQIQAKPRCQNPNNKLNHVITKKNTPKTRSSTEWVLLANLLSGELRGVGKDEVDGELGGDWSGGLWARGHVNRWSLWRLHVWIHFLPWLNESRINGGRGWDLRWEGARPCHRAGSSQEAWSLPEHFRRERWLAFGSVWFCLSNGGMLEGRDRKWLLVIIIEFYYCFVF